MLQVFHIKTRNIIFVSDQPKNTLMSQEFNSPQSTPNGTPRNNTVIYWVIIAILLAACIYMFVTKRSITAQNDQTTIELANFRFITQSYRK